MKTVFTIIAAIGRSNELGRDNNILWNVPSDKRFFRETTSGHTMIMGRKTFESLGGVLPNRHHVVLTQDKGYEVPEGVEVLHSFAEAMREYGNSDEEIFIIGGGEIYTMFMPYCQRMYLTHINEIYFNATVFFPHIDEDDWNVTTLQTIEENGLTATIQKYDRKVI